MENAPAVRFCLWEDFFNMCACVHVFTMIMEQKVLSHEFAVSKIEHGFCGCQDLIVLCFRIADEMRGARVTGCN